MGRAARRGRGVVAREGDGNVPREETTALVAFDQGVRRTCEAVIVLI